MTQDCSENGRLLVALDSREECASLQRILSGPGWKLWVAAAFADAKAALLHSPFDVVISSARFGDGHGWKDVLEEARRSPFPPELIVADRLADTALWAEVLNLGCYDLLVTPFEAAEVLRVIPMACGFRKRRTEGVRAFQRCPTHQHTSALAAAHRIRREKHRAAPGIGASEPLERLG